MKIYVLGNQKCPLTTTYVFMEKYEKYTNYGCLCWGFMAQSTQWGHVEHGQFS